MPHVTSPQPALGLSKNLCELFLCMALLLVPPCVYTSSFLQAQNYCARNRAVNVWEKPSTSGGQELMDKPHPGTVLKLGLSVGPQLYGAPIVHDVHQLPSTTFIDYLFSPCLTFHSLIPASWESPLK